MTITTQDRVFHEHQYVGLRMFNDTPGLFDVVVILPEEFPPARLCDVTHMLCSVSYNAELIDVNPRSIRIFGRDSNLVRVRYQAYPDSQDARSTVVELVESGFIELRLRACFDPQ